MGKLKLTVNEEKTRICRMPEGQFDFLGYTFGRMYSPKTGKAYPGYRPSKKSIKRKVEKIHAMTSRSILWQETTELTVPAEPCAIFLIQSGNGSFDFYR
jgi:RNA-directed DNA polymerase